MSDRPSTLATVLAIAVLFATCVLGIFDHGLWPPHEFRVGAIALEMHRSGDFVVPTLGGRAFLEKPPLYFATAATAFRILGGDPARTLRSASLLYGLLTLAATARIGFLLGGRRRALAAAAALAGTLGFLHASHCLLTDTALLALVALAFWAFVEAREGSRVCRYLFWGLAALALLSKGIVGFALVFPALLAHLAWEKDLRFLLRLAPVAGPLIFAAVCASWLGPLIGRNDGLFEHWLLDQNLGRILSASLVGPGHHDEPLLFYIPGLALVFMPWTIWLLLALRGRWTGVDPGAARLERLALCWLVVGLVFLSLARSKREIYAIPLLPAAALLLSAWLGAREKVLGAGVWTHAFLAASVAVIPTLLVLAETGAIEHGPPPVSVVAGCLVAGGSWFLLRFLARRPGGLGMPGFWLAPCLLFVQIVVVVFPVVDRHAEHGPGLRRLERVLGGEPVASWRLGETFVGSFSFHLGRVPERDFRRREELLDWLADGPDGLLIVRRTRWPFENEPDESLPGFVDVVRIAGDEWIVVVRPGPWLKLAPRS